ncbi:uncharacterized protein LOC126781198 [Nymphalis io]|uniref:uncharacterized protein LOC126781198 n=1 Tax=Inachis io TaxID=171585 RepID=UPI00216A0574|nr:uncharacterized protein LOC126781198 [Nymphalis io]XP_050362011.1 uncharacterized protein LOC126781198 [Nymphalis io]
MRSRHAAYFLLLLLANPYKGGRADADTEKNAGLVLAVTASVPGESVVDAPALAELAVLRLRAVGEKARAVQPPSACLSPGTTDIRACRNAIVAELARGSLHVAFLTVPAANAPAAWLLHEAGLDELGDVAPPVRRVCIAAPPARSLLDLSDLNLAQNYYVSHSDLAAAPTENLTRNNSSSIDGRHKILIPEWCIRNNTKCATLLSRDSGEARLFFDVIRFHHLYASVHPIATTLTATTRALGTRSLICDWDPERIDLGEFSHNLMSSLGPPPCDAYTDTDECPFESRRIVKLVNARALSRSRAALLALLQLRLNTEELHELTQIARNTDPKTAANRFLVAHPAKNVIREVRVAVLLPNTTHRETYDASSLAAAAALAEADLEKNWSGSIRFKTETYDDHCDATRAVQYLYDAPVTGEYDGLSAVAGPACGSAFADVARQGLEFRLPAIAYTPQALPTASLALLAAGDARMYASVFGSIFAKLRWRRLAALSEPATRASLAAARLQADIVAHLELPDDRPEYDPEIFTKWAERVAEVNGRVIYLCVEDARAARAALCAGLAAGLTPRAGAVWLLPASLALDTLTRPGRTDRCSREQLRDMLDGHVSVVPEWALPWLDNAENNKTSINESEDSAGAWRARWRTQCGFVGGECARVGPEAALLYDSLRLWALVLGRLFADQPKALYNLHDLGLVRSLVSNATKIDFKGLTGQFKWVAAGNDDDNGTAYARSAPLVVLQWDGRSRHEVGRWERDRLELQEDLLIWRTADGRVPDDGGEQCALQPIANLFNCDCRTAFVILGSLILTLAVAAISAIAFYCKRRAERKYRSRLEALGLHSMLPKTIGLDRWEIPRERVVINRKLGMGAFGTVYGGYALLTEDRGWTAVAVKTLKAGASTEEKLDFLSEAEAMKRFDHKNVVRLLAVVTKTEPVCTVMEYMLHGDLKNYLLARRHLACAGAAGEDEEEQVSARRLTGMALDVARALSYLAQLRYVHRDVAARNCLVSARRVVKLADFGMTRLVFENDYYRFSRKGMLPVRWMAPESLALGVFSPASDVWSFGVLLYEIVTFGSLPFQGLSNSEVLTRVKGGQTLELPIGLKPQLEGLIKSCWQHDYKARPTASEVAAFLADAPRLLAPCLDVPLDTLSLDGEPPWRVPRERAEARWVSWAAPASQATDTTYLSADMPRETDRFLT